MTPHLTGNQTSSGYAIAVAASALATALTSCGGGAGSISAPMKRCMSLWNRSHGFARAEALLEWQSDGDIVLLLQPKPHGRCKLVVGASGLYFVRAVYIYRPARRVWVRNRALEGTGGAEGLPPWNAEMNDDGSLRLNDHRARQRRDPTLRARKRENRQVNRERPEREQTSVVELKASLRWQRRADRKSRVWQQVPQWAGEDSNLRPWD